MTPEMPRIPRRLIRAKDVTLEDAVLALSEQVHSVSQQLDNLEQNDRQRGGGNGGNGAKATRELLGLTGKILLGVLIPGLLAIGAVLWSVHGRLSAIEGNRFTSDHGQAMEDRLQEEIRRLPPKWLTDRLEVLEERQAEHERSHSSR